MIYLKNITLQLESVVSDSPGGQRQRIGIARALYHDPKVLILDEATSALDNLTEQAVMEEVKNIGKDLTIIIIAHRLNTVKKCDNIFLLEKRRINRARYI